MDDKDNDHCFVIGGSSSSEVVKSIASSTCVKKEDIGIKTESFEEFHFKVGDNNAHCFAVGGGSTSNRELKNIDQIDLTSPQDMKQKEKSNSDCIFTIKEVTTDGRPWDAKKVNATKTEPYEPYQFVGLYICKEHNGVRCLGTVIGYSPEKNNKLIVQYKEDGRIEYMTQLEALYGMAKSEDFLLAQPTPYARRTSKKKIDKKKADKGEGSTADKKKATISGGRNK